MWSLFLLFGILLAVGHAEVVTRVQVRTVTRGCESNERCKDPRWSDFLALRPMEVSSLKGAVSLPYMRITCTDAPEHRRSQQQGGEGPVGQSMHGVDQQTRGSGNGTVEIDDVDHNGDIACGASSIGNGRFRYCCRKEGTQEEGRCTELSGGNAVWHEIKGMGGKCAQQVLIDVFDISNSDSPTGSQVEGGVASGAAAPETPPTAHGASSISAAGKTGRHLRGVHPQELLEVPAGLLVDIQFLPPSMPGSDVLSYCLADQPSLCGQPVAQRFCTAFKGCAQAAAFIQNPLPLNLSNSGRMPKAITMDNSTESLDLSKGLKFAFLSISCSCPFYPNMFRPVYYMAPITEQVGSELRRVPLDMCKTVKSGKGGEGEKSADCGQPSADAWCKRKGLRLAQSYEPGVTIIGPTYVASSYEDDDDDDDGGAEGGSSGIGGTGRARAGGVGERQTFEMITCLH